MTQGKRNVRSWILHTQAAPLAYQIAATEYAGPVSDRFLSKASFTSSHALIEGIS
jgi:hypothetical protein